MNSYRIGVDVGGTNTDAIIIDENNKIIAKTKTFTTSDILGGISRAIQEVVGASQVDVDQVSHAMLGTTQCTNAIVERKKLDKVITIRLAGPATRAVLPFADWPKDLEEKVDCVHYVADGGYEYDASVIREVNPNEIEAIVQENKNKCHNYAVSCVFAPINSQQEEQVRDMILALDPAANVSISSEIGTLSLLERENATILNSALHSVIKDVVNGFKESLRRVNIKTSSIYLCQNDGTLMDVEYALQYPVLTIASGPTNSIRGGIYLTQQDNGIILDVGGTTSDIGVVTNGFPRETNVDSEVGGVSTNFRMPDIISVAIGGGTIVREKDGEITVGPDSVGYALSEKALVFGGDTMTLSDIAVRLGMCDFGDKSKAAGIELEFAQKVMAIVKQTITDAIALVKVSKGDSKLILVGGGSVVVPQEYDNISETFTPENHDVANAIGSTIAKVSGQFEGIVSFAKQPREEAIETAKSIARKNAVKAGAVPDSIEVVEIEEFPIAYHPEDAVRMRVKVVGELDF
jgi:N-methylhydantoinase A/oxoprolinase/acetone carboxylase beta subunit